MIASAAHLLCLQSLTPARSSLINVLPSSRWCKHPYPCLSSVNNTTFCILPPRRVATEDPYIDLIGEFRRSSALLQLLLTKLHCIFLLQHSHVGGVV
ncbi:hypothetical protein M438DRAFT_21369 [Aureobasidium pullulans EXF-150]|uniref:Uncharacterized protein n=1 Tax=Aureobasidium pullulans EXF-150 TaxID=1043002 RepID=A0A074XP55_AURPU|nr:uncharacterized protein M438DRAFT_21369 [Aureobasidium pullulans EXF-150]KEQ83752.1 hypothetical protein M438DRAFT_21369 [Aureobasidium pullulans EXF-150]